MSVPVPIHQAVRARAHGRCEYCHSPEWVGAARFTMDHLVPRSRGGTDTLENLALACRRCNERRYTFTTGRDPVTQQEVPLFHPVQERWQRILRGLRMGSGLWGRRPQVGRLWHAWISTTSATTTASSSCRGPCGSKADGTRRRVTLSSPDASAPFRYQVERFRVLL